jgi:hypothetical protein
MCEPKVIRGPCFTRGMISIIQNKCKMLYQELLIIFLFFMGNKLFFSLQNFNYTVPSFIIHKKYITKISNN